MGLSTRNSFYLERPLYTVGKSSFEDVPDVPSLVRRLEEEEYTHMFVNDFIVEERDLPTRCCLGRNSAAAILKELICADGQWFVCAGKFGARSMTTVTQQVSDVRAQLRNATGDGKSLAQGAGGSTCRLGAVRYGRVPLGGRTVLRAAPLGPPPGYGVVECGPRGACEWPMK